MPDFVIRSLEKGNPRWKVELANCDRAHAESVLEQLELEPSVPSKLELVERTEQVVEPAPSRFWPFRGGNRG